jgi:hypothetical protein
MRYFREEGTASPLLKSDCNPVLCGCRVTRSLVFCVDCVDHCLSYCHFLYCIVDVQNVMEHVIIFIYFSITSFIRMYSFCYYVNYIKMSHIIPFISPRSYIIPWAYRLSGWYHDLVLIKDMIWKMPCNDIYLLYKIHKLDMKICSI